MIDKPLASMFDFQAPYPRFSIPTFMTPNGDLDLENGRITTSVKGGDIVRHPLLPTSLDRLRAIVVGCKPEDPLFTDPRTGKGWNLDGGSSIPM